MSAVLDYASWFFLSTGALFLVIGGIGLLRLPDFYARTHPASMIDTLGAGLVLLGLGLQSPDHIVAFKLAIVFLLILISSPTAAHALVKAAYAHKLKVQLPDDTPPESREENRGRTD